MNKIITTLLIISIILSTSIFARTKSDEFIQHTADIIFNDCENEDMIINVNGHIQNYSWPYQREGFDAFLKDISQYPFKEHKVDGDSYLIENGNEGLGIIRCGNNKMDILGTTWYWNDVELSSPTTIERAEISQNVQNSTIWGDLLQTANSGDEVNQIGKSDNSDIQQNIKSGNWFLNIITNFNFYLGISITIAFSFIIKWIFKLKITRKKK